MYTCVVHQNQSRIMSVICYHCVSTHTVTACLTLQCRNKPHAPHWIVVVWTMLWQLKSTTLIAESQCSIHHSTMNM